MKVYNSISEINIKSRTVVILGKFDGVHLGHQKLIAFAKDIASQSGYPLVAISINMPGSMELTDNEEKLHKFESFGVDIIINVAFDEVKDIDAETFIKDILCRKLNIYSIVSCSDCRFGKNAAGDIQLLNEFRDAFDYKVYILDKYEYDGMVVSSTLIREELIKGEREKADILLGNV